MTREENMRDDLRATRERQERLRSEVRHLNQKQKEVRDENRHLQDENRHLSAKVATLQDGVAGALIAMEEGDAERARVLLEHALGLPVLERSPDESRKAGEDSTL
jgi:predicted nuclease with TOPRIM domain